jgi:hypothetical protein
MARLSSIEWLGGNRVRLRFVRTARHVFVVELPIANASRARLVDSGIGLDPGDGLEFSAFDLYDRLNRGEPIRHRHVSVPPPSRKSGGS